MKFKNGFLMIESILCVQLHFLIVSLCIEFSFYIFIIISKLVVIYEMIYNNDKIIK